MEPPLKTRRSSADLSTFSLPSSLHLQESILLVFKTHLLRRLLRSTLEPRRRDSLRLPFRRFVTKLPSLVQKVAYPSRCSLETNTFPVVSKDLAKLSSIASFFWSTSSFCLLDEIFPFEDILEFTSVVSHIKAESSSFLPHLLDCSFSIFLPRLLVLEVTKKSSDDSFISFCKSLMITTTIIEFHLEIDALSAAETLALAELFYTNNTLKSVKLSSVIALSIKDEEALKIFTSILHNSVIQSLDLSGFKVRNSNVLLPLSESSSLKSIVFPRNCHFDSVAVNNLKINSSIKEVTISHCSVDRDFPDVLKCNSSLKNLSLLSVLSLYLSYVRLWKLIIH
ncbi:hypothetical protein GEMRC1_010029 [Eukaryota sp. GEM-RC1]